jgi:hypothetical protein
VPTRAQSWTSLNGAAAKHFGGQPEASYVR